MAGNKLKYLKVAAVLAAVILVVVATKNALSPRRSAREAFAPSPLGRFSSALRTGRTREGAASSARPAAPAKGAAAAGDLPIFSQLRGQKSGVTRPTTATARSTPEWEKLWSLLNSGRPLPAFDFSRVMVVAVFDGEKPTGGYDVQIKKVQLDKGTVHVLYHSSTPPPGTAVAQTVSHPFHLAVIPREEGQVEFDSN